VGAEIGIDDGQHAIGAGSDAVIVLVPQNNDGGPALDPNSGAHAVNVQFAGVAARSALDFVGAIDCAGRGIGSGAPDRADVGAGREVSVGDAGAQVREAAGVVPIGVVVRISEVGAAGHFQMVGQTRMSDGEIIFGGICRIRELSQKGHLDFQQFWV